MTEQHLQYAKIMACLVIVIKCMMLWMDRSGGGKLMTAVYKDFHDVPMMTRLVVRWDSFWPTLVPARAALCPKWAGLLIVRPPWISIVLT